MSIGTITAIPELNWRKPIQQLRNVWQGCFCNSIDLLETPIPIEHIFSPSNFLSQKRHRGGMGFHLAQTYSSGVRKRPKTAS